MKVLLAAYQCRPGVGSEPGIGWMTPITVSKWAEVWLLTADFNRAAIEEAIEAQPDIKVNYVFVPTPPFLKHLGHHLQYLGWLFSCYLYGRKLNKKINFDVVQHLSYVRYWTPPMLALLKVPFIWGPIAGHEPSPIALRYGLMARLRGVLRLLSIGIANCNPFLWYVARESTVTLVCSKEMRDHAKKLGARETIITIPTPPLEDVLELAKSTTGPVEIRDKAQVVCVAGPGRVLDWKALHLAIRGLKKSGRHDVVLRIFGTGPEETRLRRLSEELGLESQVIFDGDVPREDMLLAMRDAIALIHPALHDGGATVIVEAMSLGVPAICLDIGGPAIILENGTGFAVDATSQAAASAGIGDAINKLMEDPELRRRMYFTCRGRVADSYTWQNRGALLRAIYESVTSHAPIRTNHLNN